MELLKRKRESLRSVFTVCANKIGKIILEENPDFKELAILHVQLKDKFARLVTCQEEISNALLKTENDKQYEKDLAEAEDFRDWYLGLNATIEEKFDNLSHQSSPHNEMDVQERNFKLPKIEIKKFSGNAKDYIPFWNQFQKIHLDQTLSAEDKFRYLLQSVVPQSKAARIVESFPVTAENYPKVVMELKERFGREDLLVQIYVRDILSMAIKNASSGRAKIDIAVLYDELGNKLRALDILGRTEEKYEDILIPLVEACLPEDLFLMWKRNRIKCHSTEQITDSALEKLMNFLKQIVRGEEMVTLVRSVFGSDVSVRRDETSGESSQNDISPSPSISSIDQGNIVAYILKEYLDKRRSHYVLKSKYVTLDDIQPWSSYGKKIKTHRIFPVYAKNPQLNKKVSLYNGDITALEIDAIVNSANATLRGGGGVDGAIHRAAGRNLLSECSILNGCKIGEAKITWGYKLPAKYVIHTVGPVGTGEQELISCYRKCLYMAIVHKIRTIAFPCISTGVHCYPNEKAAHVAIKIVREVLEQLEPFFDRVIFCLYAPLDVGIYRVLMQEYFPI